LDYFARCDSGLNIEDILQLKARRFEDPGSRDLLVLKSSNPANPPNPSIPWDIRDFFTVDRQMDAEGSSKVRSSLHNQATAFVANARRLGLRAADEDCASKSKNQKGAAGGVKC